MTVILLSRILSNGSITLPWGVQLSLYTAPMYFMAFISIIGLILVIIGFDGRMHHRTHNRDDEKEDEQKEKWAIKSKVQLENLPLDAEKAHLEILASNDGE